jgi:hypothetical protein
MSEALRLAESYADAVSDHRIESLYGTSKSYTLEKAKERDAAHTELIAELRRLAPMEAELQQAREERTALLVNEQNLREELAALRASLSRPVAYSMTSSGEHTGNLYEDLEHAQERKAFMDQKWPDRVREIVPLFAIKDTK